MDELSKVAIDVLFEDFRARWQELLNIESEINTWAITYITALFLTIAWVLGQKNKATIIRLLKEQKVLIISLALINASYMLMLSAKDNRLQQNALYLYEVVTPRITELSGETFNYWEQWRRQNTLTWGRTIYNLLIVLPTISISAFIFLMFGYNERPWKKGFRFKAHNIYFYCALLFNLIALFVAVSNMRSISSQWDKAIQEHESKISNTTLPSAQSQVAARAALKALRKVDAATEVGVDLTIYNSLIIDAKVSVDEASNLLPNGKLKDDVNRAMEAYIDAKKAWGFSLKSQDYLSADDPEVQTWGKKYSFQIDANTTRQIHRDEILKVMWQTARTNIGSALSQIK